jgi:hypothetical protein
MNLIKGIPVKLLIFAPLIIFAVFIAYSVIRIDSINYDEVQASLKSYFADRSQTHFEQIDDKLQFQINDSKTNLFVFGSSNSVISDNNTFVFYLNKDLKNAGHNVEITNFAYSGADSFILKEIIKSKLSNHKPDIIILSPDGDDYTRVYHKLILPKFHTSFLDIFLKFSYFFYKDRKYFLPSDEFDWFARLNKPRVLDFLQTQGLVGFNTSKYRVFNTMILESYKSNIQATLDIIGEVPTVLIIPVQNLEARPYGNREDVWKKYSAGLAANNYNESIKLLMEAKQNEIYSPDIFLKLDTIEWLRNLEAPNRVILDFQSELERAEFEFGDKNFIDYCHMRDNTHRLLAEQLMTVLENNFLK